MVSYWLAGWLYENAARGARVDCVIELRPSTCFGRVHLRRERKFIRILLVVRLFTRSGGYCVSDPSVWWGEASFGGEERSAVATRAGLRMDFVRVRPLSREMLLAARDREYGASPVRHLRPADLKTLRGMWAGELLLPRLPEARVEAPQEGLPATYRHGHERGL